jgi:hypothetical protein
LAWAAGLTTLSGVASLVEATTAKQCPPFDPHGQRFDQSHFYGRFCRMILMCDPLLLLFSENDVKKCRDQLCRFTKDTSTKRSEKVSDRDLWEAKRVVEGALDNPNPDEVGDFVPHPFRMSGFVPFNIPISVSMIAAQSTLPLLFWAWVNQSQNAMVNYYNRNPSSDMSTGTILKSYAAAVGSALAVAFGLASAIQKKYPPEQAKALLKWVSRFCDFQFNCLCAEHRSTEKFLRGYS